MQLQHPTLSLANRLGVNLRTIILSCLFMVSPAVGPNRVQAQLVIAGVEAKLDVTTGEWIPLFDAGPDSLAIIDCAQFPPKVQHVAGIANSVIGPPSNVAITPDGKVALVANSLKLDRNSPDGYVPDTLVQVVDLTRQPPQLVGTAEAGRQPSGISITPDGRLALVANRADGTITVLSIDGTDVKPVQTVKVGEPEDQVSDVAISPHGKLALASVTEGYHLRVLEISDGEVTATDRKLSVCGKPYRTVITPDGELGLTAGSGQGAPDVDALTVVDLTADPIRTIDFVPLGNGPESFGVSPDGKLVAVMLVNGSNVPPQEPLHNKNALLVILARRGKTYEIVQQVPVGPIVQGAAFTADGKYLLAECYIDNEIWVFRVNGETVQDTGHRIHTPGFPSSIRAAARPSR
jgi:DNA-binding beta-propeller fold protein YncE